MRVGWVVQEILERLIPRQSLNAKGVARFVRAPHERHVFAVFWGSFKGFRAQRLDAFAVVLSLFKGFGRLEEDGVAVFVDGRALIARAAELVAKVVGEVFEFGKRVDIGENL